MIGPLIVVVITAAAVALLAARYRTSRHGTSSGTAAARPASHPTSSRDLTPEFHDPSGAVPGSGAGSVESDPTAGSPPDAAPARRRPMSWEQVEPGIREQVEGKIAQLSTLPTMMTQLLTLLQDSDSDPREISRTASTDPAVVAEILRTVNSSFYGLRTRITDVSRALLLLGYNKVKLIVLRLGVHGSLAQNQEYRKRLGAIWRHSFLASEAAAVLTRNHGGGHEAPTAALLHDLGKLLLLDLEPRRDLDPGTVFRSATATAEERIFVEEDYFGVNHCLIGERIAEKLQLSDVVLAVQAFHHHALDDPRIRALDEPLIRCIAAVKLGNMLAHAHARHPGSADLPEDRTMFAPDLEPYRRYFPSLVSWERLVAECERPLREAWSFVGAFLPPEAATETEAEAEAEADGAPETTGQDQQRIAGRYTLLEKLGEGSVGAVHLCEDALLGQQFAIKILRPESEQSPQGLAIFLNEVKVALKLAHPNIVRVFHYDRRDGVTFILQEFLEGRPLSEALAASGARGMNEQRAIAIATQLADALAYAHDHCVVHRDVNPNNVMVDRDDGVKLLDFGVAACKTLHGAGEADSWGYVAGTASYMSPEHWQGIDRVDPRSDLYSLGVVLYELLSGRRPFSGETGDELRAAQRRGEFAPLPSVSPAVSRLVERCLEASPDRRWADCRELAEQLRRVGSSSGVAAAHV